MLRETDRAWFSRFLSENTRSNAWPDVVYDIRPGQALERVFPVNPGARTGRLFLGCVWHLLPQTVQISNSLSIFK